MKLLLALAIMMNTCLAAALVSPNKTWEQIFKEKGVSFIHNQNLGGIDFKNACLTETEVRSIKPMKYCPKLIQDKKMNWVCEKWETGIYRYPRSVEMGQGNWVKVPQTFYVRVYQSMGSYSTYPGFPKQFMLPFCK